MNFVGFSDAGGGASATVNIPYEPVLLGYTVSATFVILDMTSTNGISAVANSVDTLIGGGTPVITSVNPPSGLASGGKIVTISGSNFHHGATVRVGGVVALSGVLSTSTILFLSPPGVVGPADVEVQNPDGNLATLTGGFTYVAVLTLSQVSPSACTAGTTVAITGAGIQTGATVTAGGVAAPVLTLTPTSITFTNPAGVACDGNVVVTNPDNQVAQLAYEPTPGIANVLSGSGPAAGGSSFAVVGGPFLPGTTVTVDGSPATISFQNVAFLLCVAPPGSPGQVALVVSSAGGCSTTDTFVYF
jgi:hypothetical protein